MFVGKTVKLHVAHRKWDRTSHCMWFPARHSLYTLQYSFLAWLIPNNLSTEPWYFWDTISSGPARIEMVIHDFWHDMLLHKQLNHLWHMLMDQRQIKAPVPPGRSHSKNAEVKLAVGAWVHWTHGAGPALPPTHPHHQVLRGLAFFVASPFTTGDAVEEAAGVLGGCAGDYHPLDPWLSYQLKRCWWLT